MSSGSILYISSLRKKDSVYFEMISSKRGVLFEDICSILIFATFSASLVGVGIFSFLFGFCLLGLYLDEYFWIFGKK